MLTERMDLIHLCLYLHVAIEGSSGYLLPHLTNLEPFQAESLKAEKEIRPMTSCMSDAWFQVEVALFIFLSPKSNTEVDS